MLTREVYDQAGMRAARRAAVEAALGARFWGLVLGTLGRQGNPRVLRHLQDALAKRGLEHVVVRGIPKASCCWGWLRHWLVAGGPCHCGCRRTLGRQGDPHMLRHLQAQSCQ